MAKYTFWVGWEADDDIPDKEIAPSWPAGMKGWVSGYGGTTEDGGYRTWCARVDADTAEEAEKIVRGIPQHGRQTMLMQLESAGPANERTCSFRSRWYHANQDSMEFSVQRSTYGSHATCIGPPRPSRFSRILETLSFHAECQMRKGSSNGLQESHLR